MKETIAVKHEEDADSVHCYIAARIFGVISCDVVAHSCLHPARKQFVLHHRDGTSHIT